MKSNRLILILLACFTVLSGAFAESCKFGTWMISTSKDVVDFPKDVNSKNWSAKPKWTLGKRCRIEATSHPIFAVTTIQSDSNYRQAIGIDGGNLSELRLNGKVVSLEKGFKGTYFLYLTKGENSLAFRVGNKNLLKKPAKKDKKGRLPNGCGGNLRVRLSNLGYMAMTPSQMIESARLAINHLGKRNRGYESAKYLAELDRLEKAGATEAEIDEVRYEALVANNPVLKFDEIILRSSRSSNMPNNWRGNSHYTRAAGKEHKHNFHDEMKTFDLKSRKYSSIYKPSSAREGLMDICMHYDGTKLLYSGLDHKTNCFQVYEMNIDGTGKRQITPSLPEVDSYNGVYLPNGKILFCSTASMNSVPCVNGNDYVGTLFEIKADGTGMRQVAFDQENDWYPWVKENGRVMYSRWEYTDNAHYFTRILMEMNPDGTNNRSIYGSNSYWPNTLFYAKQIPGHSSKFAAIVSGHHGVSRAGELIIFDSSKGEFEDEGAIQRIPGRGQKVVKRTVDNYIGGRYPRFLHPYPLSKEFYLVSGKLRPHDRWSIYLVDTFDNMIKVAESNTHLFEPVPVAKRQRPPVIPDKRIEGAKDATLFIQDIYAGPGLKDIPRGTVDSIRIFTYGYAYRLSGGHDALAIEGGWDTKRVLGTVKLEKDGSVIVKIPASMPISIQPLDKDGQAIQIMRSWLAAQPGEVVACVGCHEPSSMTPPMRRCIAATKDPQELTPWSKAGQIYGYGFKREIQPILDKYCVGCHDGSNKKVPNFADISEKHWDQNKGIWRAKPHFSYSYMALHPYVRRPGPESDMHLLNPFEFHASTSELVQMLNKGHHGVKLDTESKKEIVRWIDLNVPYHATWKEVRDNERTQKYAKKTLEYKKLYSGIEDDIEWMPEAPIARPEFVKPEKVERPEPVTLKGWPLAENQVKKETKVIKIGDKELTLVKIPAGKFVMGSVDGFADESPQSVVEIKKPFWMSTTEITNEQFQQFNPKHDSKSIDQQWKDHVYAGYPAYKPEMPVIRVSWNETIDFCKWVSEKTGLKVNIPTEAQWEWAARAGSDQPFFFGTTGFENYANLADQSIGLLAVKGINPKPVKPSQRTELNNFVPRDDSFNDKRLVPDGTAQYKPNAWGLYDMIGNVAEWTRSAYKPYPYKSDRDEDAAKLGKKVVRGGSWRDRPKTATSSYRLPYEAFQKVYNVGFRIIIEE